MYRPGEAFRLIDARAAQAARLAAGGDAATEAATAADQGGEEEQEEEEELNEYELARVQNIMRNQEFLQSLGLA